MYKQTDKAHSFSCVAVTVMQSADFRMHTCFEQWELHDRTYTTEQCNKPIRA